MLSFRPALALLLTLTPLSVFAQEPTLDRTSAPDGSDLRLSDRRDQLPEKGLAHIGRSQRPGIAGVNGLAIQGSVNWQVNGNQVRLQAGRVTNTSTTRTSGTLRLELWAGRAPYSSGSGVSGYQTAVYTFSQVLKPGYYYDNVNVLLPFDEPPAGTYYMTVALTEYNSGGYLVVDGVNTTSQTFGGGGGSSLDLTGVASYQRNGTNVNLRAERVANNSSTRTSGSLRLALWATAQPWDVSPIGYRTAIYPFTSVLAPRQYFSDVSANVEFKEPPSGTYYMTMALEEYNGSDWSQVDTVAMTTRDTFNGGGAAQEGLQFKGTVSYEFNGTAATLRATRIENNSSTRTSGSLRMELWALDSPYAGGTITGRQTAVAALSSVLDPRQYYENLSLVTTFLRPPNGRYYMSMLLTEWNGTQWIIRDSVNFEGITSFDNGTDLKKAEMTSPAPGTMLSGSCATFAWSNGSGARQYYLRVGSTLQTQEYFDANVALRTSQTVCGLPGGSTLAARLYTDLGAYWDLAEYTYTTQGNNNGGGGTTITYDTGSLSGCPASGRVTTISWSAPGSMETQVRVNSASGPAMTGWSLGPGSSSTGPWVSNGMKFYLVDRNSNVLAFTTVTINCGGGAVQFYASPNPVTSCSGGKGTATLYWNAPGVAMVRVRVGSTSGTYLTGEEGPVGSSTTGYWVTNGMQFFLVDASNRALGSVAVNLSCR
jgi:hypothetical protein